MGICGVTEKTELNVGFWQISATVQVTVAVPPAQRSGTITEAASLPT